MVTYTVETNSRGWNSGYMLTNFEIGHKNFHWAGDVKLSIMAVEVQDE